jgi:hypothetical protein
MFFGFSNFTSESAGPFGIPAPVAFGCRSALGDLAFPCFFDQRDEPIKSQLPVAILGARFLDCHRKTGRPMNKGYGGGDFIDMLTARPA